jgi:hypothetical protein
MRPASANPTATAAVQFTDEQLCCGIHPHYVAVRVQSDKIHVIPTHPSSDPIEVPIFESNVVALAFIGPYSTSVRLGYIADTPLGTRLLRILSISADRRSFSSELTIDLPADTHCLRPLARDVESTAVVFTREGIIRIHAPQSIQHTVEHLAVFLPPDSVILQSCHFYDDVYLLSDSSGGLIGAYLPAQGRPRTEFMRNVGATSSIVAIDRRRFLATCPFGTSVIYDCVTDRNGFLLTTVHELPGTAPILQIAPQSGLMCAIGRGQSGSLRLFDRAIDCAQVAAMPLECCLGLWTAFVRPLLYICTAFFDASQIVTFDGKNLAALAWPGIEPDVLLFAHTDAGFVIVASRSVQLVDPSTGEQIRQRTFKAAVCAVDVTASHIVVVDEEQIVRVLSKATFESKKRWHLASELRYLAATDETIALFSTDNSVLLFPVADSSSSVRVALPPRTIPVSMVMHEGLVLVGTASGTLITVGADGSVSTDKVGDSRVMLHRSGSEVVCSGDPPFVIGAGRTFLKAAPCEDIGRAGDFLCCLHDAELSIFSVSQTLSGSTRLFRSMPGLLQFAESDGDLFCLLERPDLRQSVVRFSGDRETARCDWEPPSRISLFRFLEFDERPFILTGDDRPSVSMLDRGLKVVASYKTLGLPTAAVVFGGFLVVARVGAIDVFALKDLDGAYEMDWRLTCDARSLVTDLAIAQGLLLATDQQFALAVYRCDADSISKIAEDPHPKRLNRIALVDNLVFASSYDCSVFCYELADGAIFEIGSFQLDSNILCFCLTDSGLLYGTAGGGIGRFQPSEDEDALRIQEALDEKELLILPDRKPPALFEWKQRPRFVDIDTLRIVEQLPIQTARSLLAKAKVRKERLKQLLADAP